MSEKINASESQPSDAQIAASLQGLPQLVPSQDLYQQLHALSGDATDHHKPTRYWPLGAVAASLMIVGLLIWMPDKYSSGDVDGVVVQTLPQAAPGEGVDVTEAGVDDDAIALDVLMARSAYLESVLAALPDQGRVQRVGTASTISAIEDRVAFIDQQLSQPIIQANAAGNNSLWRQRVGLMNTLVSLRATPSEQIWL